MRSESALRASAHGGDLDAMARLGSLLLRDLSLAEELGMPAPYAERVDEGAAWLRRAAEAGHVTAMLALADLARSRDRSDEQERWLRRAAATGEPESLRRLRDEAADDGSLPSPVPVAEQGGFPERPDRAVPHAPPELPGPSAPSGAPGGAPDVVTVATTVAITAAVLPFVQALAARLATDTYDGVRRMLRRLAAARAGPPAAATGGDAVLVVEDPDRGLRLDLRTDATDEALRALDELALVIDAPGQSRGRSLVWDAARRSWRVRDVP